MPEDATPAMDLQAAFDDAPCGLLLARADGGILRANRTFHRWLGGADDALAGRRFQDLLSIGGRLFFQTHFQPLLQIQRSVAEVKLDLLRADGSSVPVVVNASRHAGPGGDFDRIAVFVAQDRHAYERELLVARRRAEEAHAREREVQAELRRADQRKDAFLAMLAHELRNPLAPISSAASLLVLDPGHAERVLAMGRIIQRQSTHLARLVDDLLDVSRVSRGLVALDLATLDLGEVCAAAVEQARPLIDARRHFLVREEAGALPVRGDRTRLVQVVANLLNNAARYTPPGGTITLRCGRDADHVLLQVIDTGLGIDAALLPHVFELFAQGERSPEQGGLGIGLALARSLVGLHGGEIGAESAGPGLGSCFSVRLPRAQDPGAADGDPARPAREGITP